MAKKTRIDYKKKNRLTPEFVSDNNYSRNNDKEYALNFGSAFRMMKNGLIRDKSENKDRTPAKIKNPKIKKSKNYKRNKKMLSQINQLITDPQFPIGEQARLVEIRKKIELQIRENCYDQKALEKLVYSVLNPQIPLNL
jgi:hypothetical protein